MRANMVKALGILVCLATIGTTTGYAQAVFSAGSASTTATDIGYAEMTGPVTLTVISGTAVAAPIVITYSAPITNNDVGELSVTGDLAGSGLTLDKTNNSIIVNIPAGGTAGDYAYISGVRVAVAGLEASEVTASLYSPVATGNSIVAGQSNLVVIDRIMQPFSLDQSLVPPLSYSNGVVTHGGTSFTITENYPDAFVVSSGSAGRIRFSPFPNIPEGVQITFNDTAVDTDTGARFTTLSGNPETVPRPDGSTDVVYQFVPTFDSLTRIESFQFGASMTVEATGSATIQFQAELQPIGLAVPTVEFPSTAIPRYAQRLVPDEAELITGSTELIFPFRLQSDETYTGIALTNPMNYRVRVTLTAYDANGEVIAGSGVTNPVQMVLPRSGQYAKLASEIFGAGFNASSPGTIRAVGQTPALEGFYLTGDESGPKLDGGIGKIAGLQSWHMPVVFRDGVAPFNLLEVYNPGSLDALLTLRLMDVDGNQVASRQENILAGGLLLRDIEQIFGIDLNSFQGGYIRGSSNRLLVVRNNFGNALESNVLAAQPALPLRSYTIPHFASGGHYSTELTLVNSNDTYLADITLTLLNDSGEQISEPVNLLINTGEQLIRTVADLFPDLGSNLVTGSIKVDIKDSHVGPFISVPALSGSVRFANSDGSASACLPLVITPSNDFVYSHVAQAQGWFTGVAVLNSNPDPADITIDVYGEDGLHTGTNSIQLQPGERFAKLVWELIPESAGQSGGYVRISSDAYLTSFSLFGSEDLRSLSAIPPQAIQ